MNAKPELQVVPTLVPKLVVASALEVISDLALVFELAQVLELVPVLHLEKLKVSEAEPSKVQEPETKKMAEKNETVTKHGKKVIVISEIPPKVLPRTSPTILERKGKSEEMVRTTSPSKPILKTKLESSREVTSESQGKCPVTVTIGRKEMP